MENRNNAKILVVVSKWPTLPDFEVDMRPCVLGDWLRHLAIEGNATNDSIAVGEPLKDGTGRQLGARVVRDAKEIVVAGLQSP